jgi:molybdopterin-guanine dinucleotide biosynthesis protein A
MTLTAVLFAGGLSQRMGTDKAMLKFNGEPLWARQIGLLRELNPATILISARERPAWCPLEIEAVLDIPSSRGPLSGLAAALRRIQTTHLLALAIDLPQMTSAHLRTLLTLATPQSGCVPQNEFFFEPLAAIYPSAAHEMAANALARGELSLQKLVKRLVQDGLMQAYPLRDSEKSFYHNVNTPGDLQVT